MTGIESSRTAQTGVAGMLLVGAVMLLGTVNFWVAVGLNIAAEGVAVPIEPLLEFYAICLKGSAGMGTFAAAAVGVRHVGAKEQSSALRRLKRSLTKPKDRPLTVGPGAP